MVVEAVIVAADEPARAFALVGAKGLAAFKMRLASEKGHQENETASLHVAVPGLEASAQHRASDARTYGGGESD